MRDQVNRVRKKIMDFSPRHTEDIPLNMQLDCRGEFFRFDSGVCDISRFVIFATKFKEEFIKKQKFI
jgi:hypothetical protein